MKKLSQTKRNKLRRTHSYFKRELAKARTNFPKEIDAEKILKAVEEAENRLVKTTNYSFTTKGIVHLVINLVEEQLK